MASKYPTLLSALKLGDLTLKNRVVLAPMTRARSGATCVANDMNVEYYTQRANAGLVITEGSHVSKQVGEHG
jgi:2,4-dienoyl-CoA reductase-like NADH-dependent reductase (Old Yellow Enzyme family)